MPVTGVPFIGIHTYPYPAIPPRLTTTVLYVPPRGKFEADEIQNTLSNDLFGQQRKDRSAEVCMCFKVRLRINSLLVPQRLRCTSTPKFRSACSSNAYEILCLRTLRQPIGSLGWFFLRHRAAPRTMTTARMMGHVWVGSRGHDSLTFAGDDRMVLLSEIICQALTTLSDAAKRSNHVKRAKGEIRRARQSYNQFYSFQKPMANMSIHTRIYFYSPYTVTYYQFSCLLQRSAPPSTTNIKGGADRGGEGTTPRNIHWTGRRV